MSSEERQNSHVNGQPRLVVKMVYSGNFLIFPLPLGSPAPFFLCNLSTFSSSSATASSPSILEKNLESLTILKALVDGPGATVAAGGTSLQVAWKESAAGFRPTGDVSALDLLLYLAITTILGGGGDVELKVRKGAKAWICWADHRLSIWHTCKFLDCSYYGR